MTNHDHDDEKVTAEEYLEEMCLHYGWDFSIETSRAMYSAWGAEVRVTMEPHRQGRPDRSIVTYSVGGASETDAIERALDDMLDWLDAIVETATPPFGLASEIRCHAH